MTSVPIIETERLILREHRLPDFEPIAKHWESERTQYTGGPHDRLRAWEVFSIDAAQWALLGRGMWIVEEKASGKTAGWVGFYEPDHYDETELGWVLLEEFEGKGMAFEAVSAASAYGAESLGISAPCSYIATPNDRSVALAKKLGATYEETRESKLGPFYVYRHPATDADGSQEAYA